MYLWRLKVRLPTQSENERNFHIFYQMCKGGTDEEKERWELEGMVGVLVQRGCRLDLWVCTLSLLRERAVVIIVTEIMLYPHLLVYSIAGRPTHALGPIFFLRVL